MSSLKKTYPIGLALSGGSVKGFAHLGVLKYMDEQGIKADIIAGTSAGSLMGAFYADGYTPDEIFSIFSPIGFMEMTNLSPKKGGVFSTSNFTKFLKQHLHHKNIEDLPIPFRVVATDLDNGCQHIFSSGSLAERVTASCTIPVIFQPQEINGIHYVDGGLFRNFPVTVLREECEQIIGVNLGPDEPKEYKQTLRSVADRAFSLVFKQNALPDKEVCDFLLETEKVVKYGMFEVDAAEEIMQIGYDLAKANQIEQILNYKE